MLWQAVTEAFEKHFPGVPLDPSAPETAAASLNLVLQHIPGSSAGLERDLRNALNPDRSR